MKPVTFHEEAVSEVSEAALYYEERAFGLGFSFLVAIEEALEQVMANPKHARSLVMRFGIKLSSVFLIISCMLVNLIAYES